MLAPTASRIMRRSRRDNALLAEAVAALGLGWAAVRFLPFRIGVRAGSHRLGRASTPIDVAAFSRAVTVAARRMPFRALCFEQGLALQSMLRRRGIDARLHYGIGRDDDRDLQAHVWVSVADAIVHGGEQASTFQCVATYPAPHPTGV